MSGFIETKMVTDGTGFPSPNNANFVESFNRYDPGKKFTLAVLPSHPEGRLWICCDDVWAHLSDLVESDLLKRRDLKCQPTTIARKMLERLKQVETVTVVVFERIVTAGCLFIWIEAQREDVKRTS